MNINPMQLIQAMKNPQAFMQQMMNNSQIMQNPYMDRMAQLQQYQQTLQQPVVPTQMSGANQQMNVIGKIVDSIDVVKATDVPMDGNMYYFPKADGTEIFGKQWLPNGQTRILTFKPVLDTEDNNVLNADEKLKIGLSDEATEVFMKRFDKLEKRLDDFMSKYTTKTTTSRAKKEAESE